MPPIVARGRPQHVQQAAADGATVPVDRDAGDVTALSGDSAPVRIDRSAAGAAAAAELHANAFTSGGTIVLPAAHGPLDRGRGRALLAHELVHVGQQRRLGADLPHESSTAGRQLERDARSAERLAEQATTPGSQLPGMPLARRHEQGPSEVTPRPPGLPLEVGQAVDSAVTLAGMGAMRASGEALSMPTALPTAMLGAVDGASPPQRADASDPPRAGPAALVGAALLDDPSELDELAHKLYERIRHRLGREILLDRERSGLLTGSR
jgi:hypothetical protein